MSFVPSSDTTILIPQFNMTSYLLYPVLITNTLETVIRIQFHPLASTGLIFYTGDFTNIIDFLSISLVDGRVELRYELGSGIGVLYSSETIELGAWHEVYVSRRGVEAQLRVDNGEPVTGRSFRSFDRLTVSGEVHLGGVSDIALFSPQAGPAVGFSGCIRLLEVCIEEFNCNMITIVIRHNFKPLPGYWKKPKAIVQGVFFRGPKKYVEKSNPSESKRKEKLNGTCFSCIAHLSREL